MNIFLDETGYTGEDLANRDQTVFVLASHNFTEQESQELKNRFFSRVKANELKHSRLARRPAQQDMVINFIRHIGENRNRIKLYPAYKPFALTAKMVDCVIEPATYAGGFDLYDRGLNLALSNLLFYGIPACSDEKFFFAMLTRFQNLFRTRTIEAYDAFFEPLFQEFHSKELDEIISWVRVGHIVLGYENMMGSISNNYLDVAFAMSLKLMSNWRIEIKEPIHLVYDESSNMSKQRTIWDALVDPNLDPAVIGYDRRTLSLPIAIGKTQFDSSSNWAGLQIADILAGATARFAQWYIEGEDPIDNYGSELSILMRDWTFTDRIWPEEKFTPEDLETTGKNALNPITHLVEITKGITKLL